MYGILCIDDIFTNAIMLLIFYKKIEKSSFCIVYILLFKQHIGNMFIKKLNNCLLLLEKSCTFECEKIISNNDSERMYKLCIKLKKFHKNKKIRQKCVMYLGYHHYVSKKYDEMKKCYISLINEGNDSAMNNLGLYYYDIEKNFPEAIKYYKLAIEKGNDSAMNNLGKYYYDIEKKLF